MKNENTRAQANDFANQTDKVVSTLEDQMWGILKNLTATTYNNKSDQLDDAILAGNLAKAIKDVRASEYEVRKLLRDIDDKFKV